MFNYFFFLFLVSSSFCNIEEILPILSDSVKKDNKEQCFVAAVKAIESKCASKENKFWSEFSVAVANCYFQDIGEYEKIVLDKEVFSEKQENELLSEFLAQSKRICLLVLEELELISNTVPASAIPKTIRFKVARAVDNVDSREFSNGVVMVERFAHILGVSKIDFYKWVKEVSKKIGFMSAIVYSLVFMTTFYLRKRKIIPRAKSLYGIISISLASDFIGNDVISTLPFVTFMFGTNVPVLICKYIKTICVVFGVIAFIKGVFFDEPDSIDEKKDAKEEKETKEAKGKEAKEVKEVKEEVKEEESVVEPIVETARRIARRNTRAKKNNLI